jgi:hypothetical protein
MELVINGFHRSAVVMTVPCRKVRDGTGEPRPVSQGDRLPRPAK